MNIMNTIKAIIILHTQLDGRRLIGNYYDDSINPKQIEKRLYSKTKASKAKEEILVVDGFLVVHKFVKDSHVYVVGGRNENPLILDSVLNCIVDIIEAYPISIVNSTVSDNLTRVIIALDEICDGGIVLELDSNLVLQRIPSSQEETESMVQLYGRRIFGSVV